MSIQPAFDSESTYLGMSHQNWSWQLSSAKKPSDEYAKNRVHATMNCIGALDSSRLRDAGGSMHFFVWHQDKKAVSLCITSSPSGSDLNMYSTSALSSPLQFGLACSQLMVSELAGALEPQSRLP